MITLEKLMTELKAESLNEIIAGGGGNGNHKSRSRKSRSRKSGSRKSRSRKSRSSDCRR